jgi:LPS export ABC transporter permease LptG/LPS export ABC transporter permease LptF
VGILSRTVFREIAGSALLGALLFVFVLFLQKAGQLFSILVSAATTPETVGYLFLLLLPATMPLTLPLGVLVGTLIGLSRMSSDGEITAMRAAGVPAWRIVWPVTAFALLATAGTAYCSLYLTPLCNAEMVRVINQLGAAQLTAEIQPRVFEESFPNRILYVGDVIPGSPARWRNVFMADLTPPDERRSTGQEKGEGPQVTIAAEAVVVSEAANNRLQLSLRNGSTYETALDPSEYHKTTFPVMEQELAARARGEVKAKNYVATPTLELLGETAKSLEARIEFHQRLALPLACLLLSLTGIPLGVTSRKGGKSAAFVITVLFALFYYTALVSLIGLARERRIGAELAVWLPDCVFALAALFLLSRLERPGDQDLFEVVRSRVLEWWAAGRARFGSGPVTGLGLPRSSWRSRLIFLPQVIDLYIVSGFLFYFATLLFSFVMLTEVFNFFELLGDVFKNEIAMEELFRYLFFLAPKLIYDAAPVSVLVATLVTFGVMAKNNEITAMKACGVSVFRLALPVIMASLALSGALFAFDHYIATNANVVQDGLRNKIKGKPIQTYLTPERKWIFGRGSRIFYYKYLNETEEVLGGLSVYEVDPKTFRLHRHIYAERARWEPSLKTWIFQNGWVRDVRNQQDTYRSFQGGTATFQELDEQPSWFLKEVKTYRQMNYHQLNDYISELSQSGFNTVPLQVQYHKKFSVPLFALVMALLSIPFAFLTGTRGAMTGVGVSFGVAIAYFALNYLFEQLGNVGQLPPEIAAWSPDVIFALAGLYLMARMRT